MKKILIVITLLLSIAACGWNQQCTKPTSYNLGEEKVTVVGSEMVQTGCLAARYDPKGLTRSLWQRNSEDDAYFEPLIDKELLYAGREGDVLHISYREFYFFLDYKTGVVRTHARTPFFQQVYYDLKTSDAVVFQDWVLQILDANNKQIRFKVVNGPPQPKIPPPLM
jgi:hypothetical protein